MSPIMARISKNKAILLMIRSIIRRKRIMTFQRRTLNLEFSSATFSRVNAKETRQKRMP